MNSIWSWGAAGRAGDAALRLAPAPGRVNLLAALSIGRDHEVGIVEPLDEQYVVLPAPADPAPQARRKQRTAA